MDLDLTEDNAKIYNLPIVVIACEVTCCDGKVAFACETNLVCSDSTFCTQKVFRARLVDISHAIKEIW